MPEILPHLVNKHTSRDILIGFLFLLFFFKKSVALQVDECSVSKVKVKLVLTVVVPIPR